MNKFSRISLLITVLVLITGCVPAGAVLQQFTYKGTVTALDPAGNVLNLNATHEWTCSYGDEDVTCGWEAITPLMLNGTVPATDVFTVVKVGEAVEAASLGVPGAAWTGIGALVPTPGIENWYATDLFGDPSMLPAPLISDYGITTSTVPDCTACSGAVCQAKSVLVMVSRMETPVFNKTLAPGQKFTYPDKSDNSSVYVKFISGEAPAILCPNASPMAGPQPVSVLVIHVDPAFVVPPVTTTKAALMNTTALLALAALAVILSFMKNKKE